MIEIFHFLKSYEFINELGKTFLTGKNEMNPLGNHPISQNVWPKGPKDIFIPYEYKSSISEWTEEAKY